MQNPKVEFQSPLCKTKLTLQFRTPFYLYNPDFYVSGDLTISPWLVFLQLPYTYSQTYNLDSTYNFNAAESSFVNVPNKREFGWKYCTTSRPAGCVNYDVKNFVVHKIDYFVKSVSLEIYII